jgi:hypothetical protein
LVAPDIEEPSIIDPKAEYKFRGKDSGINTLVEYVDVATLAEAARQLHMGYHQCIREDDSKSNLIQVLLMTMR